MDQANRVRPQALEDDDEDSGSDDSDKSNAEEARNSDSRPPEVFPESRPIIRLPVGYDSATGHHLLNDVKEIKSRLRKAKETLVPSQ